VPREKQARLLLLRERGHDKLDRKITLKSHITCTDAQ